jgi:hypothetical protein
MQSGVPQRDHSDHSKTDLFGPLKWWRMRAKKRSAFRKKNPYSGQEAGSPQDRAVKNKASK